MRAHFSGKSVLLQSIFRKYTTVEGSMLIGVEYALPRRLYILYVVYSATVCCDMFGRNTPLFINRTLNNFMKAYNLKYTFF